MRGNLAQPFDARVLHRGIWIETLGDGMADQSAALFLKQFKLPLLLLNQRVNARGFAIKKRGDSALLGKGGTPKREISSKLIGTDRSHG